MTGRHVLSTQVYVIKCWKARQLIWCMMTCWHASSVSASWQLVPTTLLVTVHHLHCMSIIMMPTAVDAVASESTLLSRCCHWDASGIVRASLVVSVTAPQSHPGCCSHNAVLTNYYIIITFGSSLPHSPIIILLAVTANGLDHRQPTICTAIITLIVLPDNHMTWIRN